MWNDLFRPLTLDERMAAACRLRRRGTAEERLLTVRHFIAVEGVDPRGKPEREGMSFVAYACADPCFLLHDDEARAAHKAGTYFNGLSQSLAWENIEIVHELLVHGARMADIPEEYSYVRRMLGHRGRLKVMRRLALRSIVLFWIKIAAESSCAPGGAARKRDLCSFEADFPFRLARDSEE